MSQVVTIDIQTNIHTQNLIHHKAPRETFKVSQINALQLTFSPLSQIPQWGTRLLTSLYVMEGTENLEDEVFLKRHSKPEQDEKRRKRY